MIRERYLDSIEERNLGFAGTIAFEYQGSLEEYAISEAIKLLACKFPILRSRIVKVGERYLIRIMPSQNVSLEFLTGDEKTLVQKARLPWNPEKALAAFFNIRSDDGGYLAYRVDHAVIDGACRVAISNELWRYYYNIALGTATVDRHGQSNTDIALPKSPLQIVTERGGKSIFSLPTHNSSKDDIVPPRVYDVVSSGIRLSESNTSRLRLAARKLQTTMHAIVCGAVCLAQRTAINVEPESLIPVLCLSAVNLRQYFDPPIGPTEVTQLSGTHKAKVMIRVGESEVEVGRKIREQLERSIRSREIPEPVIDMTREVDGFEYSHLLKALVTNVGSLESYLQPDGIRIIGWRAVIPKCAYPTYTVWSLGGRLNIQSNYPSALVSKQAADSIASQTRQSLIRIATDAS